MNTKIWDLRQSNNQLNTDNELNDIKVIFENGGLIAIPTETVYGLGADARNEAAIKHIYSAKGRPSDNPLIVHIYKVEQIQAFTDKLSKEVEMLMNEFWPGPISFIVPLKKGYLCESVSGGLDSIAVRMPSHPIGRQILKYVDMPIAAPSANLSGRPSPTTFEHVYRDLDGRIDGIVNGDQSEEGSESVTTIGTLDSEKPIAPGMKYKHYSPDTPVKILKSFNALPTSTSNWTQTAFIVPRSKQALIPEAAKFIPLCEDENDIKGANHNLYQILHQLDQDDQIQHAFIYGFDLNDNTTAIMNRMMKAANQSIIEGADL